MSIRTRTLLSIGGTLLLLLLLLSVSSYLVLTVNLADQEAKLAVRSYGQLRGDMRDEIDRITRTTVDWAAWDAVYAYMADPAHASWKEANDASLANLDVDVVLLVDAAGHPVLGRRVDSLRVTSQPLSPAIQARILAYLSRLKMRTTSASQGVLDLPDAPALCCAAPILRSDRRGPARGTLVMGRYLDASEIAHLTDTSAMAFTLTRDLHDRAAAGLTAGHRSTLERVSPTALIYHTLLDDMAGVPCLVLNVSLPRTVYQEGRRSVKLSIALLCLIGCLTGLLLLWLLERLVLRRLLTLERGVTAIGAETDSQTRLPLAGPHDELHRLAVSINATLDAQHAAQDAVAAMLRTVNESLEVQVAERTTALRESEERFHNLFEEVAAMMLLIDTEDGLIVDANPAACTFYGYPRATMQGMPTHNLNVITPDEVLQNIRKVRENELRHFHLRHRLADGSLREVTVDCSPFRFGGRQLLCSIVQDVTQREQIACALEMERAYLAAAIETLTMPMTLLDNGGAPRRVNQAEVTFLAELGVAGITELAFLDPETRTPLPMSAWPLARALRGETIPATPYILLAPSGLQRDVLVHAAPIFLDGEIVAAVRAIEDVTLLKEADRAKDEFLAVLSHELQTPLTSILGWTELALASDDPTLHAQALEVVMRNARRQERLVKDMLDMSRLLHRKLFICLAPTDLALEARQVLENLAQSAEAWGGTLRVEGCGNPLPILADAVRVQQCISNLLQNAMKFTPSEGSITVRCTREETSAVLTVTDTGRGISARDLPAVFSSFKQIERDERAGGLGLGLAIVRGIIALHGGDVTADSPGRNKGSTFSIMLPLATTENAPDAGKCVVVAE